MRVIARTLGEMDSFGVSVDEFLDAKRVIAPRLRRKAAATPGADEYVSRCVAHFLYGAQLAPSAQNLRYFSRKNVPDTLETRLFNQFSSAMLEGLSNFTLEFTGAPDSLDRDESLFYYNLDYLYGSIVNTGKDYTWHSADTSALQVNCPKVKIKSEKTEPVTGGAIWTFSNGMRVVYKQAKGSGTFSYALQLNGGLAQVPGLEEGEGGYMGNLLSLYDVAGIPATAFRDMLSSNGISMETHVELNSMDISGNAPKAQLSLLLKSLLAISNNRKPNDAAFANYRTRQMLRGKDLEGELFRKLNPGYACSPYKLPTALGDATWQKAQKFYDDRFVRVNDGVLILSGDLSEENVKKMLQRYLGGFHTLRGSVVRRPVQMNTLSGVTTCSGKEGGSGFHVLMDAEYAMTTEHFYTAHVAVEALRTALVRHLAVYGIPVQVRLLYCVQPQERFQLLISCPGAPVQALPAVRAAITEVASAPVDATDLKAWKAGLEARVGKVMATPDGIVTTLLARYSSNKDITSRYSEAIGNINAAAVQAFLKAQADGGRIEYTFHE